MADDGSILINTISAPVHPDPWLIGIAFVVGLLGVIYSYYYFRE